MELSIGDALGFFPHFICVYAVTNNVTWHMPPAEALVLQLGRCAALSSEGRCFMLNELKLLKSCCDQLCRAANA